MIVGATLRGPAQLPCLRGAAGGTQPPARTPGSRCGARPRCFVSRSGTFGWRPSMLERRGPGRGGSKEGPSVQTCSAELGEGAGADDSASWWSKIPSKRLFLFWLAITGYAFFLSPNQAATTDIIDLQRALGTLKDGVRPNPVFFTIFNVNGLFVPIFAALLIPSGRSKNKIPVWPFALCGLFLGSYILMPYLALRQQDPAIVGPPKKADIAGWKRLPQRILESRLFWIFNTCYALYICSHLLTGFVAYRQAASMFLKSRMVHTTAIDFVIFCFLSPIWISNDAAVRGWERSPKLLAWLKFLPLLGPLIYLALRPRPQ